MTKNQAKWIIETLEERMAYFAEMAETYDAREKALADTLPYTDASRESLRQAREYVRGKMVATDEAIKVINRYM